MRSRVRAGVRRVRASAGSLALVGLLVLAAALLITATPHLANRYTDQGLRDRVDSLGYRARDLSYVLDDTVSGDPTRPQVRPAQAGALLSDLRNRLPAALRERLAGSYHASQVGDGTAASGSTLTTERPAPRLSLREQSDAQAHVRMVAGRWPATQQVVEAPVPAAVSVAVAEAFGLSVGSRFTIRSPVPPQSTVDVDVVGLFEVSDPHDPVWVEEPEVVRPYTPIGEDPPVPWRGVLLTDTRGAGVAAAKLGLTHYTWRFRVAGERLDMASQPELTKAVFDARTQAVVARARTQTELDKVLAGYAREVAAARAVLVVVQAGVLATLIGLVLLAAAAAVARRRSELALVRARGASLSGLGVRVLAETGPVVALAVVAGYLAGRAVPGRPGGTDWLLLVVAAVAALAAPAFAVAGQRRLAPESSPARASGAGASGAGASRAGGSRSGLRRATVEATLVLVAVAAVFLIRRRGLSTVDLFLALAPVLLASAAAVVTLRLFPYPLRLLAAGAARARGAVPFLGLARAGRAAPASAGPLAVLIVAVSVAVFCSSIAGTVAAARDLVADRAVPGDAFVHGGLFTPDTADRLAAVPGVTGVAAVTVAYNAQLATTAEPGGRDLGGTAVMVVDAPALARVLAASGMAASVPPALTAATRGAGPVPAVVSPDVAAALDGAGAVTVQGYPYGFTVAAVVDDIPGLPVGTGRFVALPRQALVQPPTKPVLPSGFVLSASTVDGAALAAAGDAGQRDWISGVTGAPAGDLETPTTVDTHVGFRAGLDRSGVDRLLSYTLVAGAAGSVLLALLAVGFAVVTGAKARGQALSRLRTLGLSPGQGRRLLAYELFPLVGLGALVGGALGVVLPGLVGPALGLSAFTSGAEAVLRLDPWLGLAAFGLTLLTVALAVGLETIVNKRGHLGEVLRVGGEP